MSIVDDLVAAKALINTPEKWGKGARRRPCKCAADAIGDVAFDFGNWHPRNPREEAMAVALMGDKHDSALFALIEFNDAGNTTHADVMALFDRAISKAGA